MIWDVEPSYRELIVQGEEFLSFPNHRLIFGPVTTCLHDLGRAGWQLRMMQRTPLHVSKTRPKISIHPAGNRGHGFKFKIRACYPYAAPADVFYDIGAYGDNYLEMSLAKYETKEIERVKTVERVKMVEVPAKIIMVDKDTFKEVATVNRAINPETFHPMHHVHFTGRNPYEGHDALKVPPPPVAAAAPEPVDVFEALKVWNDEQVAKMEFPVAPAVTVPMPPSDNVIDFLDAVGRRQSVDIDPELKDRIQRALG